MKRAAPIATVLALALTASALANDGIAEREAGGLVFKHSDEIDMLSEDLFVSADEIRVRYRFRNQSARDLRVTVGFPLPDKDLRDEFYGDVAYPSDFRTSIDGRPIEMAVEYRALWNGADHSELLTRLGVPLANPDDLDPDPIVTALSGLPQEDRERLLAIGLVEPFDDPRPGRLLSPIWTIREIRHREQVFPAGRDVIVEHLYRPGAGGTHSSALAHPDFRASEGGREMIARYCIDEDFIATLERFSQGSGGEYIGEQYVSYILTTGAGWRSPIGDFRLVVDKGQTENIVSFCGEGVRKIGPTQFEIRHRNWRPSQDLHVLIVRPRFVPDP